MAFPDTGPQADGTRTAEQWMNAMGEDVALMRMYLREALREGISTEEQARYVALARKEASRLLSDIPRFGWEVLNLTDKDLENVGPL